MKNRYVNNTSKVTGDRIRDKEIRQPKMRAEFYVRLFSFLKFTAEVNDEGFQFYIKDTETGVEFSAGLTGFGLGYFSRSISQEYDRVIDEFDKQLFDNQMVLESCQIEFEHDFGKTILGFEKGSLIEIEIDE